MKIFLDHTLEKVDKLDFQYVFVCIWLRWLVVYFTKRTFTPKN